MLIYMGVLKDGKTAVFLVDHGASRRSATASAGRAPRSARRIRLRAGETEFFDVKDDDRRRHAGSTSST